MNRITKLTRQDIKGLFHNGIEVNINWKQIVVHYYYNGRVSDADFLGKLYSLKNMPSNDNRVNNAEEDIINHTSINNDWDANWIFDDNRFNLIECSDTEYLSFICAVFHPENRDEKGYWKEYLIEINKFLKADGFELYESNYISNRAVYSWRLLSKAEMLKSSFVPFSIRNESNIKSKKMKFSLNKSIRSKIASLFNCYDDDLYLTTNTGWNYNSTIKKELLLDISTHYPPKAYNPAGEYEVVNDIDVFIMSTSPYCVYDAIELFYIRMGRSRDYLSDINNLFNSNNIPYSFLDGKIETFKNAIKVDISNIQEDGLRNLISEAEYYIRSSSLADKQTAIEKIWDALERLKTYYKGDKKQSVIRIVGDIAHNEANYIELFNDEFLELTSIGNKYRIRHHETDKIEIIDPQYYDYLFNRCSALIELATKYLS